MKKIQAVPIWYNGQDVDATLLNINVTNISLGNSAKIDYSIADKEAVDESSVDKLDQEAKIYFMQQVKQGKIKELPKDPKAEYMKVKMTKKELKEVIREQIKNLTK